MRMLCFATPREHNKQFKAMRAAEENTQNYIRTSASERSVAQVIKEG